MSNSIKTAGRALVPSNRTFDPRVGTKSYSGPKAFSTDFSTVKRGKVRFDPSIRNIQSESMGRLGEGITRYLGDTDALRARFTGNQSAFRQARLNPLEAQLATRRGEIERSIGSRGMSGSSFGDQAITNFDIDAKKAIGDASALAEMEDLQALSGLDQNRLNAILGVATFNADIAAQRLAQEMAGLGIAKDQINQAIQLFQEQQQRRLFRENSIVTNRLNWTQGDKNIMETTKGWAGMSSRGSRTGSLGGQ